MAEHVHGRDCDRSVGLLRRRCRRPGRWMPTLIVRPADPSYRGPGVVAQMDLRVCDEHRATTSVGSLVTPTTKLQLQQALKALGRAYDIGPIELTFEQVAPSTLGDGE